MKLAVVGLGGEGRNALLKNVDPAFADVRALCDINPDHLTKADEILAANKRPPAKHYADWKEMLQKEDLEAVVLAPPLWLHTEMTVGCLEAGKHVLCEKMMAWDLDGLPEDAGGGEEDAAGSSRSATSASTTPSTRPPTRASSRRASSARSTTARLVWHRNQNWRRKEDAAEPRLRSRRPGATRTGSTSLNWRLYWKYSKGLLAELASHQVNISNWFFGAVPEAVHASGRRLPLQGRPRGGGPRLRHLRVPAGEDRGLLHDRVQRLRRLLRDVHGHQGDAHPEPGAPGLPVRRRAARRLPASRPRPRGRAPRSRRPRRAPRRGPRARRRRRAGATSPSA